MMKIKPLLIGLGLGVTILSGCSDDLNLVGSTIQPDGDKMPVYVDTFQMQATTLLMDSVYARTTNGLLGEFYDPLYGNVKSDYICQFYCPDDFKFKHEPINGQIDSIDFKIMYQNGAWVRTESKLDGSYLVLEAPVQGQVVLLDEGGLSPLIFVLGGAGLAALLAVLWLICRRRKSSFHTAEQTTNS